MLTKIRSADEIFKIAQICFISSGNCCALYIEGVYILICPVSEFIFVMQFALLKELVQTLRSEWLLIRIAWRSRRLRSWMWYITYCTVCRNIDSHQRVCGYANKLGVSEFPMTTTAYVVKWRKNIGVWSSVGVHLHTRIHFRTRFNADR